MRGVFSYRQTPIQQSERQQVSPGTPQGRHVPVSSCVSQDVPDWHPPPRQHGSSW
jgi:hypothetical protein